MIKAEPGLAFKFLKYRISNFQYNETGNEVNDYEISFNPAGEYNEKTGLYNLTLDFFANDKATGKQVITVTGKAEYQLDKPCKIEEIPSHFFLSAIPIFFPYLRAFVSNLTLQANASVIVLQLINFTNMADHLRQNTRAKK